MRGPGKVVDPDDSGSFGDWKDFRRMGEAQVFEYNPAASDIVPQNGAFPEVDDAEYPEKM